MVTFSPPRTEPSVALTPLIAGAGWTSAASSISCPALLSGRSQRRAFERRRREDPVAGPGGVATPISSVGLLESTAIRSPLRIGSWVENVSIPVPFGFTAWLVPVAVKAPAAVRVEHPQRERPADRALHLPAHDRPVDRRGEVRPGLRQRRVELRTHTFERRRFEGRRQHTAHRHRRRPRRHRGDEGPGGGQCHRQDPDAAGAPAPALTRHPCVRLQTCFFPPCTGRFFAPPTSRHRQMPKEPVGGKKGAVTTRTSTRARADGPLRWSVRRRSRGASRRSRPACLQGSCRR